MKVNVSVFQNRLSTVHRGGWGGDSLSGFLVGPDDAKKKKKNPEKLIPT